MSPWRQRRARVAVLVGLCLLPGTAHAGPAEEFQQAKNAYTFGDYKLAVANLDRLLNPKVRLEFTADIQEALELLGIASFYEADRARAREAFVRLLSLDPDHSLDPLLVRPEVVDFFSSIRTELRDKLEELRRRRDLQRQWEQRQGAGRNAEAPPKREVLVRPYVLNWVPFGVPQFTYNSKGWGGFFLASQAAAALASVGAYSMRENLRRPDGAVTPGSGPLADTLGVVQVGSGLAFFALALWGVADAHMRWPGQEPPASEVEPPTPP